MNSRQSIIDLVDSIPYVTDDLYMGNVTHGIDLSFNVKRLEAHSVVADDFKSAKFVVVRMRLRNFWRQLASWRLLIPTECSVIINDYDTAEFFDPTSALYGAYLDIADRFPTNCHFIVQSEWWAAKVRETGISCTSAKQWVHPSVCNEPKPWDQRLQGVAFSGSMHGHRKTFFDNLKNSGIDVKTYAKVQDSQAYLQRLQNLRISVRSELRNQPVQMPWQESASKLAYPNSLWQRDIECASQGCFSLREADDEMVNWNIQNVPSIITFSDTQDCVEKVSWIERMDPNKRKELVYAGIETIKADTTWLGSPSWLAFVEQVIVSINTQPVARESTQDI